MNISKKTERLLRRIALYAAIAAFLLQLIEKWSAFRSARLEAQSRELTEQLRNDQPDGILPLARMLSALGNAQLSPPKRYEEMSRAYNIVVRNFELDVDKHKRAHKIIEQIGFDSEHLGVSDFLAQLSLSPSCSFVSAVALMFAGWGQRQRRRRKTRMQMPAVSTRVS